MMLAEIEPAAEAFLSKIEQNAFVSQPFVSQRR